MNGTLYGIGVGPGDPELLTLKAVRILQQADIIACPARDGSPGVAYQIALQAVPVIHQKQTLPLSFPMSDENLSAAHRATTDLLLTFLKEGKSVAFVTLGDPTLYSTFSYLQKTIQENGCPVEIISGVPSFCAAAARLGISLTKGNESVRISPDLQHEDADTVVFMKCGKRMKAFKQIARESGRSAYYVENCGLENETVCSDVDRMPDEAGYFSVMILKE